MSKCSSEAATILTLFCFNLSHWTFDFFSFFLLTMLSIQWRHVLAAVVHAVASQHDGWRTVQVVAVGRERTDPVYLSAYKEGPRRYCRFLTFLISHVETRRTNAEWKCLSFFFVRLTWCVEHQRNNEPQFIFEGRLHMFSLSLSLTSIFGEKSHYIFTIERLFIVGFLVEY